MGLNRHSAEIETQTTQRPGQEGTGVDPQPTSRHSVIEWLCKCPSSSPGVLIGFNNLLIASIQCNPIVDPCENVQHLGSLSTRGVDNGRGAWCVMIVMCLCEYNLSVRLCLRSVSVSICSYLFCISFFSNNISCLPVWPYAEEQIPWLTLCLGISRFNLRTSEIFIFIHSGRHTSSIGLTRHSLLQHHDDEDGSNMYNL